LSLSFYNKVMIPFFLSSWPPPEIFACSSYGMKTPYRGPATADATRPARAPPYKIGITPALSKKPKLYKNPTPPAESVVLKGGLA